MKKKSPAKRPAKTKAAKPVKAAQEEVSADLNDRQKRFCEEYLIDLNATQAYLRAGYESKDIDVACAAASRLLADVRVQAFVTELQKARSARTEITQDRVLKELALIGFMDIAAAFDASGNLKSIQDMPEDVRRALAGIEVAEIGAEGVKFGDLKKLKIIEKTKALELIGRHLKMFTDKVEQTGKNGGPIEHKHDVTLSAEESYRKMLEG